MGLEERKLDFQEADRRCAELKRQLDAGIISEEEFDAQRKKLMVQDDEGRWWAKSRETGEWYYHDESGWIRGTPRGYQPYQASPTDDTQEQQAQPEQNEGSLSRRAAREDDKPRWRRRWVILPILLLLLTLLGGSAYALIRATNENENVAIPDLVGASSVEEAQRMAGGNVEVVEGDGVESQEPIGTVLSQDPAAGEMVGEGSSISVNVSRGASLPDVRGETRDEAVRSLERAGFEVDEETEESSAEYEGYVSEQDPRGGGRVTAEAGSTVTITVGEGPATQAPEKAKSPAPKQTPVPPNVTKKVEEPKLKSPPPPAKKVEEPKPELPPTPVDEVVEADPGPPLPPVDEVEEPDPVPPPPTPPPPTTPPPTPSLSPPLP
jgi:beta-lactam-binding protein with PASTA domain